MVYVYDCLGCARTFEVVKHHTKMEDPEQCPDCKTLGERRFVPSRVHLARTQVTHAEYNPGLGKVIQNRGHLKDELARHEEKTGVKLVEVGNDFGSGKKMNDHYTSERKKAREEGWKNLKVELP